MNAAQQFDRNVLQMSIMIHNPLITHKSLSSFFLTRQRLCENPTFLSQYLYTGRNLVYDHAHIGDPIADGRMDKRGWGRTGEVLN